jgi:DNA-binding NarL/FixJ family response regulator
VDVPLGAPEALDARKKTRVLIADGFALARDAMKALLSLAANVEVVGEATDAGEVLETAARVRPDVVLVHTSMPGMRNFGAVRALRRKGVDARIIVIARHSTPEDEFLAAQSGADGYVARHAGAEELLALVRSSAPRKSGATARRLAAHVLADISDDARVLERLSKRELEALRLVVDGKSSAEIARILNLSRKTVETSRSRLMKKLGVSDLPTLVKLALQHGITTLNSGA